MKLTFLGAAGEFGRSAVLLEADRKILFDYGIKMHQEDQLTKETAESTKNVGNTANVDNIEGVDSKAKVDKTSYPLPFEGFADLAILSHAHLDHSGFFPQLFEQGPTTLVGTPPTQELAGMLVEDSMRLIEELPYTKASFKRAMKHFMAIPYEKEFGLGNTSITLHDAGHIAGAALVDATVQGKRIVYTGDYKMKGSRMHHGAEPIRDVDVVITESTYGQKDHPKRQDLERELVKKAQEVVENGGNLLLPCFAVGRSQEMAMLLRAFDRNIPIVMDGMGIRASMIMRRYPEYLRSPKEFDNAMESIYCVEGRQDRRKILDEPCVIIATAGMLQGGPAMGYLLNLNKHSKVIFSGYSLEGTNGWYLRNKGVVYTGGEEVKIQTPVEYLDFSAHAGRTELLDFVKTSGAQKVYCIHGDKCSEFAAELRGMGFDATAPKIGESFEVK